MNELLIQKAKDYIRDLFSGNSDGHDLDHSLRVYSNAMTIAETEPDCNIEVVALAALLHDADDHKLFAIGGKHSRSLDSSIDHFHEKLLLLKDGLNTAKAHEMAAPRHAFLEEFIKQFNAER